MRKEIEQVFVRYAMEVTVEHRETVQRTRAFVQSVRPERGDEPFEVIPPGAVEERFWRYLGSAETPLEMGDRVICGGKSYIARNAAPIYAGSEIACYWAVLHPEEETCAGVHGRNGENHDGNGTGQNGGG